MTDKNIVMQIYIFFVFSKKLSKQESSKFPPWLLLNEKNFMKQLDRAEKLNNQLCSNSCETAEMQKWKEEQLVKKEVSKGLMMKG